MMFRWRKLLIFWILVIVFATTMPWSDFQDHSHWDGVLWIPFYAESLSLRFLFDIVADLLLFLPFGYLLVRSQVTEPRAVILRVTLLASLVSAAVELTQVFAHNRNPSMTDICSNVIGATIGAAMGKQRIKSSASSSSYEEA